MSQPHRQTLTFAIQTPEERGQAQSRRDEATARIERETGITQELIDRLVDTFYGRVQNDDLIGPVFADVIGDWTPHLEQMKLFWSSVALSTGVYQGRPMPKHLKLPIDARHFDRWLHLFESTASDICTPVQAEHFMVRARRIAQSLELGVASANGVLLDNGERYRGTGQVWTPE
ncbi:MULTISPECIES: group III truncated hemoglobin [unclassified Brevundimonas]|uniref:group III truncated hemoglobin n=1 Tax=unclassified Brevundimonas TaxID=2622653 RepID=UPI0025C0E180|nr:MULTISPECIES: group III truncated hemoglobin [unclassified Brevundimonas]